MKSNINTCNDFTDCFVIITVLTGVSLFLLINYSEVIVPSTLFVACVSLFNYMDKTINKA